MARQFTMTETILKEWFVDFNDRYFDGELHMPHFEFSKARTYLGQFNKYTNKFLTRPTIKMSIYLDRSEHDLQNTFIHEMIHLWQYEKHYVLGHGESFKRKAREINRYGWEIQRCSNTNGAVKAEGIERRTRRVNNEVYLFKWTNDRGIDCWCQVRECGLKKCIEEVCNYKANHMNVEIYKITAMRRFSCNIKDLRYYDYDRFRDLVDNAILLGRLYMRLNQEVSQITR